MVVKGGEAKAIYHSIYHIIIYVTTLHALSSSHISDFAQD